MAVTSASKMRMLKVYERFNRIRASNNTSNSNNVSLVYGAPYAVGTNAAVKTTDEVILANTPTGTLNKVTIYDTRNYASPRETTDWQSTFTAYVSMEEILAAVPATNGYVYLGKKGATEPRNRHGVGIGATGSGFWSSSLNVVQLDTINTTGGNTSTRAGIYQVLTEWQESGPWDDSASFMNMIRINDGAGMTYLVICPSVAFQGTTSSATVGLRVVYNVADKGLTYSQPGRLIIEEITSNLVEE